MKGDDTVGVAADQRRGSNMRDTVGTGLEKVARSHRSHNPAMFSESPLLTQATMKEGYQTEIALIIPIKSNSPLTKNNNLTSPRRSNA